MDEPHMLHTPQESDPADAMEALLIEEITQVLATLELDLRSPSRTASLRAASVEALGRAAGRHERLLSGAAVESAGSTCGRISGKMRSVGDPGSAHPIAIAWKTQSVEAPIGANKRGNAGMMRVLGARASLWNDSWSRSGRAG